MVGRSLASMALGRDDEPARLAFVDPPPLQVPPEPFRFVGGAIIRRAILRKEAAEERGARPRARSPGSSAGSRSGSASTSAAERLDAALGRVPGRLRDEFLSHSERNSSSFTQGTLTTMSPGSVVAVSVRGAAVSAIAAGAVDEVEGVITTVAEDAIRVRDLRSACRRRRRRTGGRAPAAAAQAVDDGIAGPRIMSAPEPPTTFSTDGRIVSPSPASPSSAAAFNVTVSGPVREL